MFYSASQNLIAVLKCLGHNSLPVITLARQEVTFQNKYQQTLIALHSRPRSTMAASHVGKPEAQKREHENLWFSRDKAETALTGTHKTLLIL